MSHLPSGPVRSPGRWLPKLEGPERLVNPPKRVRRDRYRSTRRPGVRWAWGRDGDAKFIYFGRDVCVS